MVRVRIVVTGVVQGVGFRYFTLHLARSLHLAGYVRNRMDGAVEVEAEGDENSVHAFLEDLSRGPRGAYVTGMEVENLEPDAGYDSFEVRF